MSEYKIHSIDSAPDGSKPLLEGSQKAFGMIPNLHGVMAEAPTVLEAYQKLHQLFTETSLSSDEQNVVWLTINVEHECHYCVPAHTGIAKSMQVSEQVITALRDQTPLEDKKLEALRTFTLAAVRKRGAVNESDLEAFYDAGFTQQQVLEVLLGVSQKVLSNYVNHIAKTPVDEAFKQFI
ncbi:carboxymuconolactone decarboxylase family protein [Aliidiomarina sp.]|uniref:carboxymuconolactone decarboxylase family protein n=1 Tax=Aliidiomarina sp. TaxID=1872439 RepID=UPI003A4E505E